MELNQESNSRIIEEILLTSEEEAEEILIDSDTNDSSEAVRSNPSKLEKRQLKFSYDEISSNTLDSDINPASESNFIIPHSDSDTINLELIEDQYDSLKESDNSSNHCITEEVAKSFLIVNRSLKLDENNNINYSLPSTSTPCNSDSSRLLSRFNDLKLLQPCTVVLHRVTESVIQSFKPKLKRKYEITYKDDEFTWSSISNGQKKKYCKKSPSSNSLSTSISTSSITSVKPKTKKSAAKKPKRAKKTKECFNESIEPKLTEILDEETNFGFEKFNYTCQISDNDRIKLKICKSQTNKDIQGENEEGSNHTIMLASSRSSSPTKFETVASKIIIQPSTKSEFTTANETAKLPQKKDEMVKKPNPKVNKPKKSKIISKKKINNLKKHKEDFSLKKSLFENMSDRVFDRTYRIPKLNQKADENDPNILDLDRTTKQPNEKNKKKTKKKSNENRITKEKPTTPVPIKENTIENTKRNKKYKKTLEIMSRDQIPKLKDLKKKRAEYNLSIGAKYPYFSLMYMIDDYVKRMSTVACLDFNLLINNCPVEDSELSITSLNRDEQIQLCRLISRSAGMVNQFEMVNMDPMLREYPEACDFSSPEFINSDMDDEYFLNLIDDLTMSEAYILYKRFLSRLNSPFRSVEHARVANSELSTLYITFENDHLIESSDLSIESVVVSSLHRPLKKFSTLRNDVHLNCVYTDEDSNSSNHKLVVSAENYDLIREKLNDDELVNKMYTKSVYEKYCHEKMPIDFYKQCVTHVNPKPKNDDERAERFLGHRTYIRSKRGEMRLARKHKILNDYEFEERLLRLQTEQEIQIDFSQFTKSLKN